MIGIIWNSIVDHIPMWGWMIIFGAPIVAALYFFGPILLPIWRMIPLPVRIALIGLLGAVIAFLGGRYKGRANAEEERRQRNHAALQKRAEVDRNVETMGADDVQAKLHKWDRD